MPSSGLLGPHAFQANQLRSTGCQEGARTPPEAPGQRGPAALQDSAGWNTSGSQSTHRHVHTRREPFSNHKIN